MADLINGINPEDICGACGCHRLGHVDGKCTDNHFGEYAGQLFKRWLGGRPT